MNRTMNVIRRNFFRLVRIGVFGSEDSLEPMSNWKWKQLLLLASKNEVTAVVWDGLKRFINQGDVVLKKELSEEWNSLVGITERSNRFMDESLIKLFNGYSKNQLRPILMMGRSISSLYPNPFHRVTFDIDIFFPYEPQAEKADEWAKKNAKKNDDSVKNVFRYEIDGFFVENHRRLLDFTNRHLNRQFQRIINGEIRCCDSTYVFIENEKIEILPPTLYLLFLITKISRRLIDDNISLKLLIDLGIFLRKMGDKVDFVKFQLWIEDLKMIRIANIIGLILVDMLGFDFDELPFVYAKKDKLAEKIKREIFHHHESLSVTDKKDLGVLRKESRSVYFHVKRCTKYFGCFPREMNSTILFRIAHSLDQVEE